MALIHKFIQDEDCYIIDVNSGAVHLVDKLVYDLIDEENLTTLEKLMVRFQDKYSRCEIEEAYEDINELVNNDMLYSGDLYEDIALNNNSPSYVKALCLNVVHDCNLKCKYCFAEEGQYKGCR